jgi:hypothetical protein
MKYRHRTVNGDRHRLCFSMAFGNDETKLSHIRFDIIIICLNRLAQLMMH